jgi:hypothetical protein
MALPSIKILISCHKQVCYPQSDLFIPVHVGAEGKTPLAGMQPDNEGENISDRNFTFCEMSGQYWAWKNLDADYVGQCHYRRYFCFDNASHEANDHKQIEDSCLSDFSIQKYHLSDEVAIREVVENCDLVCAPRWSVKGVPTPCGPKKTIRDHMVAYGLVTNEDLDRVIEICRELHPDFVTELEEYLSGHRYLGYNCFIMKRGLFNRLCEFEFSVLQRFDAEYDYSRKTTTHKRICGYLGEILYSVFVDHVTKEGVKVSERPLVFFDATPAPYHDCVHPLLIDDSEMQIVWRYTESNAAKFAIAVISLIRHLDQAHRYRLTVLHDICLSESELSSLIGALPENLSLSFVTFPVVGLSDIPSNVTEEELRITLPFYLDKVFISRNVGKVLWVEGCALFQSDPALILNGSMGAVCAAQSVFLEKELNKPANHQLLTSYLEQTSDWLMLEASALVLDLSLFDHDFDVHKAFADACARLDTNAAARLKLELKKYSLHKQKPGTNRDSMCLPIEVYAVRSLMLNSMGAKPLELDLAYSLVGDGELATWACEETVKKFRAADADGLILYTPEQTPFAEPNNPLCARYWALARTTVSYEPLMMALSEYRPMGLKATLFPVGTRRRKVVFKIVSLLRAIR